MKNLTLIALASLFLVSSVEARDYYKPAKGLLTILGLGVAYKVTTSEIGKKALGYVGLKKGETDIILSAATVAIVSSPYVGSQTSKRWLFGMGLVVPLVKACASKTVRSCVNSTFEFFGKKDILVEDVDQSNEAARTRMAEGMFLLAVYGALNQPYFGLLNKYVGTKIKY